MKAFDKSRHANVLIKYDYKRKLSDKYKPTKLTA